MTKFRSKSFRPSMLALEGRCLLAAPIGGDPGGDPDPAPPPPPSPPPFDEVLSVGVVSSGPGPHNQIIKVDGSDYDDVVKVLAYEPGGVGLSGYLDIQLEQYSNGTRLFSLTAR